jgi:hypothetical protein
MCYKGEGGVISTRPYRRLLRGKGLHQHWRTEQLSSCKVLLLRQECMWRKNGVYSSVIIRAL